MGILNIPVMKQMYNDSCGASAVQMVLEAYGIDTDHTRIYRELKNDINGYTKKTELRKVLESYGAEFREFAKEASHGDVKIVEDKNLEHLLSHMDEKKPIITNISTLGSGHYIVLRGYDQRNIFYNDSTKKDMQKISDRDFESSWKSANGKWVNWYMVIDSVNPKKEGI